MEKFLELLVNFSESAQNWGYTALEGCCGEVEIAEKNFNQAYKMLIEYVDQFISVESFTDEILLRELCDRYEVKAAPIKTERFVPHKSIILPIGFDHIAELIMTNEAYQILMGTNHD